MMCFVVYFFKSRRIRGGFREIYAFSCVILVKRAVFVCISAKLQYFTAFYSVLMKIILFGNDNGKFTHDLVAKQPTQKRNGVCKTIFSRNTTRHPVMLQGLPCGGLF